MRFNLLISPSVPRSGRHRVRIGMAGSLGCVGANLVLRPPAVDGGGHFDLRGPGAHGDSDAIEGVRRFAWLRSLAHGPLLSACGNQLLYFRLAVSSKTPADRM